jgi:hypothetical protein
MRRISKLETLDVEGEKDRVARENEGHYKELCAAAGRPCWVRSSSQKVPQRRSGKECQNNRIPIVSIGPSTSASS